MNGIFHPQTTRIAAYIERKQEWRVSITNAADKGGNEEVYDRLPTRTPTFNRKTWVTHRCLALVLCSWYQDWHERKKTQNWHREKLSATMGSNTTVGWARDVDDTSML